MVYRALLCCLLVLLTACSATPAASAPAGTISGRGTATPTLATARGAAGSGMGSSTMVAPGPGASAGPVTSAVRERERARVVRVVDGDTIDVQLGDGRVERVRYIGVDTPETVDPRTVVECFGVEASVRNRALVGGREVELERDVSERDRYGRLLRYVWVAGADGAPGLVNETLVQEGYAATMSYPPDVKYQDRFAEAEQAARGAGAGLWGACGGPDTRAVTPTRAGVPARVLTPMVGGENCHPSYPTLCLPASPDLDCKDVPQRNFPVLPPDPHRLDGDGDGIGCET